jgi:diadenosine tetraphosphatase ApaH/serine/threonine PP2A family protein phosphatase
MSIAAENVLSAYSSILTDLIFDPTQLGKTIPIPSFSSNTFTCLCKECIETLKQENVVVEIQFPIYAVGDIHGNLHDLIRILHYIQPKQKEKIVFLGDYIDRGDYSTECLTLLMALKVYYPNKVFLIRGNHEFQRTCSNYGFKDELFKIYGTQSIFELVISVFSYLPFAVDVSNRVLCIHGGISPYLHSIKDILEIPHPVIDLKPGLMADLVWSDPIQSQKMFQPDTRGTGVAFNSHAIREFLMSSGYKCIIRGHECVSDGFKLFDSSHVVTVFSSSGYDQPDGKAAIVHVTFGCLISFQTFLPIEFPKRSDAIFEPVPEIKIIEEKEIKEIPPKIEKKKRSFSFSFRKKPMPVEMPKIPKRDNFKFSFIWKE